jgi:mannose-6-phosphate isomerase-like protein (cupin superfamily)
MNELEKGLEIAAPKAIQEGALPRFLNQIREWGIALPDVTPLVLDFGLADFDKVGLIEYWIANEMDAGYCAKYLFVFDGQSCPLHHHKTKHETFFVIRGELEVTYDGAQRRLKPGDVLPIEAERVHGFTGAGPALLLEVSKPCVIDDNYFEDKRIPIGGNYRP